MVKRKEKIEDPLKLLLPGAIYDYFELVHSDVSDVDVHLFLDEVHNPPRVKDCESKGFTEQSIIQDFPLRGNLYTYIFVVVSGWIRLLARYSPIVMT